MKDFFDTKIIDFGLPVRETNALIRGGINTINELFELCDYSFEKGPNAKIRLNMVRNIGKQCAETILDAVNSKKPDGVYLGMTKEELEKFKLTHYSEEELEEYNREKQAKRDKEKNDLNRRIFLETPIEKIDMLSSHMTEVIKKYKIKTLKELLFLKIRIYKSYRFYSEYDIAQIDFAINDLNMPNISSNMSFDEVINMCVTDEMLKLLDALIEKNSALKNESTLQRADRIREETKKKTTLETERLRETVKEKEEAVRELEELVLEKEKLKALDDKLNTRIEELLKRINYKGQKRI